VKASELRGCDGCGEPIAPVFYRVSVEQHIVDHGKAQQHLRTRGGFSMIFHGATGIADVFAGDPDITQAMGPAIVVLLCNQCAFFKPNGFGRALGTRMEKRAKDEEKRAADKATGSGENLTALAAGWLILSWWGAC